MSTPIPTALSARTIMIVAAIEFVLLMGGVALYLSTDANWAIVVAALIGGAMFAAVIIRAALKSKGGDGQS